VELLRHSRSAVRDPTRTPGVLPGRLDHHRLARGENFAAFESRLVITCMIRSLSTRTRAPAGAS